jgi:hypothetical protein
MEGKNNAYRLLIGKPKGKKPLGRPRSRWVDNNRMDLGEVGWGDVDWIGLAKDRNRWRVLVNSVMNLRVPKSARKLSSGFTSCGLSSSAALHIVSLLVGLFFIRDLNVHEHNLTVPTRVPDDRGSIYLRNVCSCAHVHKMEEAKSRISVNSVPP